ncbi:MAG: hypothetical protein R3E65_06450 [Steroidobacteraceae bacterium]
MNRRPILIALLLALAVSPALAHDGHVDAGTVSGQHVDGWWKGNTHTHTWWSDGDSPPESVAQWYRDRGYHFLVLSDHNRMQEGELWYAVDTDAKRSALRHYVATFGQDWAETRQRAGVTEVKLKTLDEFRSLFEEKNRFVFIRGMEITDRHHQHPVHLNGVNLERAIIPQGGDSVAQMLQKNIDAVVEQGRRAGRPMFAHVNHPNFFYAITAEDLIALEHAPGDGFVEVYNGHSGVRNDGDAFHPSTERLWDIVLAQRLGERGASVMYGVATDDAHEYTAWGLRRVNPGRGWVMVRAPRLTPDTITAAMKRGDFYNSTGVTLATLVTGPGASSSKCSRNPAWTTGSSSSGHAAGPTCAARSRCNRRRIRPVARRSGTAMKSASCWRALRAPAHATTSAATKSTCEHA